MTGRLLVDRNPQPSLLFLTYCLARVWKAESEQQSGGQDSKGQGEKVKGRDRSD